MAVAGTGNIKYLEPCMAVTQQFFRAALDPNKKNNSINLMSRPLCMTLIKASKISHSLSLSCYFYSPLAIKND